MSGYSGKWKMASVSFLLPAAATALLHAIAFQRGGGALIQLSVVGVGVKFHQVSKEGFFSLIACKCRSFVR